jgi:phosphotransferase system  glucose/maltose/N-acetylglucosamine-specific IIC component
MYLFIFIFIIIYFILFYFILLFFVIIIFFIFYFCVGTQKWVTTISEKSYKNKINKNNRVKSPIE